MAPEPWPPDALRGVPEVGGRASVLGRVLIIEIGRQRLVNVRFDGGLGKYLIHTRHFTGQQLTDLWNVGQGCGGPIDTKMH